MAALADLQHRTARVLPDDLTLPDYGLLTYGIAAGMAIACMLAAIRTGREDAAARWATDAASLTALAIRVGEAHRGWPFDKPINTQS